VRWLFWNQNKNDIYWQRLSQCAYAVRYAPRETPARQTCRIRRSPEERWRGFGDRGGQNIIPRPAQHSLELLSSLCSVSRTTLRSCTFVLDKNSYSGATSPFGRISLSEHAAVYPRELNSRLLVRILNPCKMSEICPVERS